MLLGDGLRILTVSDIYCLTSELSITDLSECSFTLIISSSHRPWAYEDGQSKVKGGLLPS